MRSKDRFEPDETSTEVNAARRCGLHNGIGMADGDDKARRAVKEFAAGWLMPACSAPTGLSRAETDGSQTN
jgi:hypothetical protein